VHCGHDTRCPLLLPAKPPAGCRAALVPAACCPLPAARCSAGRAPPTSRPPVPDCLRLALA